MSATRARLAPVAARFGLDTVPRRFLLVVGAVAAVAVVLRVLLLVAYTPAILSYPDEGSYVGGAANGLFSNPYRPAGYSLWLRVVHLLSANLTVTMVAQDLLGLAMAVCVYAVARRVGAGRYTALFPAALVALSGDELYLEHVLLSDGLYVAVLVAACYCALRVPAAYGRRQLAWAAAAGLLVAYLTAVRTLGLVAAGVIVVWLLVAGGPSWRRRLATAGIAGLVCAGLLLGYAFAQQNRTGVFGLTRFSGWPLYGRVATFADCRRFTPPAGTRRLCQTIASDKRLGPDFYVWNPQSPAARAFGAPPAGGGKLAAFARAAIRGQPVDYLLAVGRDLFRYVDPGYVPGPVGWGTTPAALSLEWRWSVAEKLNTPVVDSYWHDPGPVHVNMAIASKLETWRGIVRIHGWMIALGALLGLAGIFLVPDRASRNGLALLLAVAVALLVGSVMVTVYDFRNGIPSATLLMVAGASGAELVVRRVGVIAREREWRLDLGRVVPRGGR